jgi:hypothetical protein
MVKSYAEAFSESFLQKPLHAFAGGDVYDLRSSGGAGVFERQVIKSMPEARHFNFSFEFLTEKPIAHDGSPLSLPFPTVLVAPKDDHSLFCLNLKGEDCHVMGGLVWEVRANELGGVFTCLSSDAQRKLYRNFFVFSTDTDIGLGFFQGVDTLFKRMRQAGAAFFEKTPARWKIGRGQDRTLVQPRTIVNVVLKKERKTYERMRGGPIDWSHQWEVMGHWRHVAGTGKDRDGHYCVPGYTWVAPHRRGPEDKVFIKKTRLVSAETPRAIFC